MTLLSGMLSKNKNLAAIVVKVFLKFLKIVLKRVPIYSFIYFQKLVLFTLRTS